MSFQSPLYLLLFLPGMLILFRTFHGRGQLQSWLLLGASWIFYSFWGWVLVPFVLASCAANFLLLRLLQSGSRTAVLWLGVVLNVLFLMSARLWLPSVQGPSNLVPVIGVSFYTLQAIGSLIDAYRKGGEKASLGEYALFLSFWPLLLSGPICRLSELLPQLRRPSVSLDSIRSGSKRILEGLFFKVVLADLLYRGIRPGEGLGELLGQSEARTSFDILILSIGFGLYLFFDFAGYSHLAIGSALLFGVRLRENFDRPFAAQTPSEFWTRWHMSLSSWIRDYVFFPLAQVSSSSGWRRFSVLISMVVFGLWHGASWNYLLWGLYQGWLIVIFRILQPLLPIRWLGQLVTFITINLGWIAFQAESTEELSQALKSLGQWTIGSLLPLNLSVMVLALSLILLSFTRLESFLATRLNGETRDQIRVLFGPVYQATLLVLVLSWNSDGSPFVYIRF